MKKKEVFIYFSDGEDYIWVNLEDLYSWCLEHYKDEQHIEKDAKFLLDLCHLKKDEKKIYQYFS